MKSLRLDLFTNFLACARLGNLSRAAEESGLSRTALWQQLRGLDRTYRTTLFRRKRYGIELTPEGEHFLNLVEPLVAGFRDLSARFDHLRQGKNPVLRVACPDSVEENELAPVLQRFGEREPTVRVEVIETPSRNVPGLVASGEATLGIEVDPPSTRSVGLRYLPLFQRRVFVAMRDGHALAKSRLSLRSLADYPFATEPVGSRLRVRLEHVFAAGHLSDRLRVVFESSSERVLLGSVSRGDTVTVLSGKGNPAAPKGVRVLAAGHLFGRLRVYLVARPGMEANSAATAFEAALRQAFGVKPDAA
jgi:LysR family nitrogen assimilation transcriptional regulator